MAVLEINKEMMFEESVIRSSSETLSQVDFIQSCQLAAIQRIQQLGFPSAKDEDWKYYDFKDILESKFIITKPKFEGIKSEEISSGLTKPELVKLIDKYVFRETASNILVTVNGAYSKELSNAALDENFIILDFNDPEALKSNPEAASIVKKYFANNIGQENNYFKLINTVLMTKGFLLYLKDNYQATNTLQIIHISNQNHFNQMRSLIYLGKNSSLNLVVSYIGLAETQYFTNAVIEAHLEDSASLKLDKIQNESRLATRLYNFHGTVSNNSNFEYNSLSFGGKSNREEINLDINGQYSDVRINGLYVLNSDRKSHHKVVINHNSPHSSSRQIYKGLLQGFSRAEFNGLINVSNDAQQTNASQLNRNLLLSDTVHIDSRPQLNIEADDVKCSHGSSTSTLSADELFYLKSRGLSEIDAKNVLTYSFCQEIISALKLESARNYSSNLANLSLRTRDKTKFCVVGSITKDDNRAEHGLSFTGDSAFLSESLSEEANNQVIAALADNAKFKQSRYQE